MIGPHLVEKLIENGYKPVAIYRSETSKKNLKFFKKKIISYKLDLRNKKKLKEIILKHKPSIVFHLASSYMNAPSLREVDHYQINFNILLNLLDALNGLNARIIYTGTVAQYKQNCKINEWTLSEPPNNYGVSKQITSLLGLHLCKAYGLEFVDLRLFSPYGMNEKSSRLIPSVIQSLLYDKRVEINNGQEKRDYTYIDDVIDAMFKCITNKKILGKTINICSGKSVKIIKIVESLQKILGVNKKIVDKKRSSVINYTTDNKLALKLLNWKPKVNLEEGLEKTVDIILNRRTK